jgi:long-chain acyl-CoA synthetase
VAVGRRFDGREYVVQGNRRMTFQELEEAVKATAGLFYHEGLRPGQRVLLFGANAIEWIVGFWAILEVGGIVVLGNAWWGEAESAHAVEMANPTFAVVDQMRSDLLPAGVGRITYEQIGLDTVQSPAPSSPARTDGGEDDPAVILFTSGTTGLPKGAVLLHCGLLAVLQSLLLVTRRLPAADAPHPPPSRALLSLPLFHVGGLQQILTPMATGGTIVFAEGRFDPANVVRVLRDERVSVWSAVPTMVARVLDYLEEGAGAGTVDDVRTLGMGGAPVPQHLRDRVVVGFPNASRGLAVTYGLSEACGVVATGVGEYVSSRPGCVGRPLPTCAVRIDAPPASDEGEILVRSPSVMLGYLGEEDEGNGPITPDRWLRTGDVGRLDEDGYLYVTDRSKDIVIRGGENIATPNVENRLLSHPAVAEVAVMGLPHPTLGEELAAAVVLRQGSRTSSQELASHVRAGLAYFEVPSRWWIRSEPLPRNTTGKVLKGKIKGAWTDNSDESERETEWESSTAE